MKLGIVGFGVLGKALYEGFQDKSHIVFINDLKVVDPEFQEDHMTKGEMMAECQVIFICVDTPPRTDNGGCDLTKVYEVFNQLHVAWGELSKTKEGLRITKHQPIIAIKSTVIPGTLDTLKKAYPWCCSNPSFIRESHALEDFLKPDRIIIGADKPEVIEPMLDLYEDFDCEYIWSCKPAEAELIKYLSNALLVTKVAFANEIDEISSTLGVDARVVYSGVTGDRRINESHLDPSKGMIPQGSACLPKDMRALIQQLDMSGYDTHFLKTAYAKAVHGVSLDFKLEVVQ